MTQFVVVCWYYDGSGIVGVFGPFDAEEADRYSRYPPHNCHEKHTILPLQPAAGMGFVEGWEDG